MGFLEKAFRKSAEGKDFNQTFLPGSEHDGGNVKNVFMAHEGRAPGDIIDVGLGRGSPAPGLDSFRWPELAVGIPTGIGTAAVAGGTLIALGVGGVVTLAGGPFFSGALAVAGGSLLAGTAGFGGGAAVTRYGEKKLNEIGNMLYEQDTDALSASEIKEILTKNAESLTGEEKMVMQAFDESINYYEKALVHEGILVGRESGTYAAMKIKTGDWTHGDWRADALLPNNMILEKTADNYVKNASRLLEHIEGEDIKADFAATDEMSDQQNLLVLNQPTRLMAELYESGYNKVNDFGGAFVIEEWRHDGRTSSGVYDRGTGADSENVAVGDYVYFSSDIEETLPLSKLTAIDNAVRSYYHTKLVETADEAVKFRDEIARLEQENPAALYDKNIEFIQAVYDDPNFGMERKKFLEETLHNGEEIDGLDRSNYGAHANCFDRVAGEGAYDKLIEGITPAISDEDLAQRQAGLRAIALKFKAGEIGHGDRQDDFITNRLIYDMHFLMEAKAGRLGQPGLNNAPAPGQENTVLDDHDLNAFRQNFVSSADPMREDLLPQPPSTEDKELAKPAEPSADSGEPSVGSDDKPSAQGAKLDGPMG